jgi:serine/threonine protein kinase
MQISQPAPGSSPQDASTSGYTLGGALISAAVEPEPDILPGTEIGDFLVLYKIGPGGCGVVYKALQRSVSREVALKVIKPGLSADEVVARFEREKTTLGSLRHPNIVNIITGGKHAGQPFFAMEFVDGLPVTKYADKRKLGIAERLKLFLQICGAVAYAHEHGVIHRDIKPSNILVTEEACGEPVVKVIDFGIAKVVNNGLPLAYATQVGQVIGTPGYMSPEQTGEDPNAISESTDIYSLGVLLYELLVGKLPLEVKDSQHEQISTIRQCQPIPPSARINKDEAAIILGTARKRGLKPPQLQRILKGKLDEIVMKCLEKNPRNRFETVNDLAEELRSFCTNSKGPPKPPRTWIPEFVRRLLIWLGIASLVIAIAFAIAFVPKKINAPDADHEKAAKLMFGMLKVLKSSRPDISEVEKYQTDNAKTVWNWLLSQQWFKVKPTPVITGYSGDTNNPAINIKFEYSDGIETMTAKFVRENGIIKLDDVGLMEMKGASFAGMNLSFVVTNRTEADRAFARLNPALRGVSIEDLAKR